MGKGISYWLERFSDRMYERSGPATTYKAGLRYLRKGKYKEALHQYSFAQRGFEDSLGPSDPWTITVMADRALCYANLGQLELAADLYQRALHFETKARGGSTARARAIQAQLELVRAGITKSKSD